MCTYSQFMLDRGEKKGLETGKYKTYYDLISDGTLTLKQAAEKCSLSPDEFQKKLIELKIKKKGLETGKYKTYYDLISDGTLTLKQAAEKCSLSPDEFQKKLIELKITEA